ncbi:DUF2957 domain-containing protein [Cupriavidus taiwanensis]|uniref:DUF2957 domain-containing protein n=1 Tax=Cupriavidus taiwanensis TaxID=164546 RepID=UPI000E108002|nr:DUF2957 domain-containing protein [Cupriavidus taiwanensis]SOY39543.1 hypothetical protein CBM2588_A10072 [Cupriavidus taiwanensis]SOY42358.1 hypothetical protein CBM2592_A10074 [Cupriavidus taiwanensis]SOY78952.1 hypothetical protein CBM2591_A10072 [Cupriavidus taiwanensis]SOZ50157.1 hypothetical protein CBM2617_A10022 [Cupriavidus taiwanensis]SOZ75609.1 hypothetical protein CBM2622_A10023 [Cupriavidus taiwanensis]
MIPRRARTSGSCLGTGNNWKLRSADGAFESGNADGSRRYPSFQGQAITANNASRAKGLMVVGKLDGALVPLLLRAGYAQISLLRLTVNVDDESGLALMAPATTVASGQLDGGYRRAHPVQRRARRRRGARAAARRRAAVDLENQAGAESAGVLFGAFVQVLRSKKTSGETTGFCQSNR